MAAKFKYCLGGGELVIKDLKAVNDTYREGEVLVVGAADGGGVRSAGAGIATAIIGVSNQDDTLPAAATLQSPGVTTASSGAVLTGTQAAGTVENLKVIVNSDAVYAVEYDNSAQITWTAHTDTGNTFTTTNGDGYDAANIGAGWLWSYATGELDYVVSGSNTTTVNTQVLVTGTNTASATGIILYPATTGQSVVVRLNADALSINADSIDQVVSGTIGIPGVILENRLESWTYGSEILDPVTHNQEVRFPASLTTEKDLTKAFAYVRFNHVLAA